MVGVAAMRTRRTGLFRDHGHRENIVNSLEAVKAGDRSRAVSSLANMATARLFLGVKAAIDSGRIQEISLD